MRRLDLGNLSCRNGNKKCIDDRGATLTAEPTPHPGQVDCRSYDNPGYYQRGCVLFAKGDNRRKLKLAFERGRSGREGVGKNESCSTHRTYSYTINAPCYRQGGPGHLTDGKRVHLTQPLPSARTFSRPMQTKSRMASRGWSCPMDGPSCLAAIYYYARRQRCYGTLP